MWVADVMAIRAGMFSLVMLLLGFFTLPAMLDPVSAHYTLPFCTVEQARFDKARSARDHAEINRIKRELAGGGVDCPALRKDVRAYDVQQSNAAGRRPGRSARDAKELLQAAADWEAGKAAYYSGDYIKAFPLLDKSCGRGSGEACRMSGDLVYHGNGTGPDLPGARMRYQQACDLTDLAGCDDLGRLIYSNNAAASDLAPVIALFQKACDGLYLASCDHLAALYYKRGAGEQDRKSARDFYQRACDGGYGASCVALGSIYSTGSKAERNEVATAALFDKGCNSGEPTACRLLGTMLMRGAKGVGKDPAKARQSYEKACDAKDVDACVELSLDASADRSRAVDYAQRARGLAPENVRVKALVKRLRLPAA